MKNNLIPEHIIRITASLCTILVGVTYVFSGAVKLIDPVGTGMILESYFHLIHVDSFVFYSKIAGSCIGLFESILGVSVLFLGSRYLTVIMFAVQSFFTLLSLALVILNPPMHCGCFGEAIHLTHAQTLLKNIILLSMIVFVWATSNHSPQFLKKGLCYLFVVVLSCLCL